MNWIAFVLLAIDGWITAAAGILAVAATWFTAAFVTKPKNAVDIEKTLVETENLKIQKGLDLYDGAMKYAAMLEKQLAEIKDELAETAKEVEEYRQKMFDFEEKYRAKVHECNNLAQQIVLLKQDCEEAKKRYEKDIDLLSNQKTNGTIE